MLLGAEGLELSYVLMNHNYLGNRFWTVVAAFFLLLLYYRLRSLWRAHRAGLNISRWEMFMTIYYASALASSLFMRSPPIVGELSHSYFEEIRGGNNRYNSRRRWRG